MQSEAFRVVTAPRVSVSLLSSADSLMACISQIAEMSGAECASAPIHEIGLAVRGWARPGAGRGPGVESVYGVACD